MAYHTYLLQVIIIIIKGHSLRRACLQPATNTQNSKPRPPTTNARSKGKLQVIVDYKKQMAMINVLQHSVFLLLRFVLFLLISKLPTRSLRHNNNKYGHVTQ